MIQHAFGHFRNDLLASLLLHRGRRFGFLRALTPTGGGGGSGVVILVVVVVVTAVVGRL